MNSQAHRWLSGPPEHLGEQEELHLDRLYQQWVPVPAEALEQSEVLSAVSAPPTYRVTR